jgi:hypothetical protein
MGLRALQGRAAEKLVVRKEGLSARNALPEL